MSLPETVISVEKQIKILSDKDDKTHLLNATIIGIEQINDGVRLILDNGHKYDVYDGCLYY